MSEYWDDRWRTKEQDELEPRIADAIASCLVGNDCKSVLDFGGGIGRWREFWTSRGYDYFAHDTSDEAREIGTARGIAYGPRVCDLVFTNTVLIHADDVAFAEIRSLASKKIICLETCWPTMPATSYPHMRYRSMARFIELFGDVTVERVERIAPHHLLVFSVE